MALLDLQGLQAPSAGEAASGTSSLTIASCQSHKPSTLSAVLCH
jgi:hypothetical protein